MMHELAHVFASGHDWDFDAESTAQLLPACVLKTVPGALVGNRIGSQYRKDEYEHALKNFRKDRIADFRGTHVNPGCAFELYLHGLVDIVGWETYKKTIQSYHNRTFTPTKRYIPDVTKGQTVYQVQAREFLDRLAHFHDDTRTGNDPQVLRSIPSCKRTQPKHLYGCRWNITSGFGNLKNTMFCLRFRCEMYVHSRTCQ